MKKDKPIKKEVKKKKKETLRERFFGSKEKPQTFTYIMIGICMIVFLYEFYYSTTGDVGELFDEYGFKYEALMEGRWWTLFTSIFLHASAEHLMLNMIALFFFGRVVEESMGKLWFLIIFFAGAIMGDLAMVTANIFGIMPMGISSVGASAAIFGLLGTATLVRPFDFVFFPYLIPIPVLLVAVVYIFFNLTSFIGILITGEQSDVAYVAHLGGLLAGGIIGFKHEGEKKGLRILVVLFLLLIVAPLVLSYLSSIDFLNYTGLSIG